MSMTRRYLIVVTILTAALTLAVILAPAAHAADDPAPAGVAAWWPDRARDIANTVWKAPCGGGRSPEFRWTDEAFDDNWAYVADFDEAHPDRCSEGVTFIRQFANGVDLDWETFCSLAIHEFGHLAGARHTDHGVMQAEVPGDRRCRDRGRPYLISRAVLPHSTGGRR
jgi:hypothetical protein